MLACAQSLSFAPLAASAMLAHALPPRFVPSASAASTPAAAAAAAAQETQKAGQKESLAQERKARQILLVSQLELEGRGLQELQRKQEEVGE